MEFLPIGGYVNTILWMHHIDADKTHSEEAKRELHKNPMNYTEQILEAIPHETAAVRPLTTHL